MLVRWKQTPGIEETKASCMGWSGGEICLGESVPDM